MQHQWHFSLLRAHFTSVLISLSPLLYLTITVFLMQYFLTGTFWTNYFIKQCPSQAAISKCVFYSWCKMYKISLIQAHLLSQTVFMLCYEFFCLRNHQLQTLILKIQAICRTSTAWLEQIKRASNCGLFVWRMSFYVIFLCQRSEVDISDYWSVYYCVGLLLSLLLMIIIF